VCEPPLVCSEFASIVAVEMQLDLKTPDQPRLILPNLIAKTVGFLQLDSSTAAPSASPTSAAPKSKAVEATAVAMVMAILAIFA
jgi:hypothetical protein